MQGKNKYRKWELEDFFRYSQDQMSEEERNAFERYLEQDPFAAEALEGLSSVPPEETVKDLARLRGRIREHTSRQTGSTPGTRTMWYRIAAAVAVLLAVTTVLFTILDDRMGSLDRKVAESPKGEQTGPEVETRLDESDREPAGDILPVQTATEDDSPVPDSEKPEKSDREAKPVVTEQKAIQMEPVETEAKALIQTREVYEELAAREEMADMQMEETEEEAGANEVAAPAMALERPAPAKSMKRGKAVQMQPAATVSGDQRIISGVVIAEDDGQPLAGAVVAVKGGNTGMVTGLDGRFRISVTGDAHDTLIAEFLGMEPKEIPVDDRNEWLIKLQTDVKSADEVVVIGSGPGSITKLEGYSVTLSEYDARREKSGYRPAMPVGGTKEFNDYVISAMQFPEGRANFARAVVVLNFTVGNDGRPQQILVLKSPAKAFSEEAIRLLVEGPDWEPARINGVRIEESTRIRIVFKTD